MSAPFDVVGAGLPPALRHDTGPSIGDQRSPQIRVRRVALDNARQAEKLSLGGRFLWAVDSEGTDAAITVAFNEPVGQGVPMRRGVVVSGIAFDDLYITNVAQSGKSLTLLSSMVILDVTNATAIASLVEVEAADTIDTPRVTTIGAAATLLLAANSGRKAATVYADPANTETIFIGGASVAVGSGFPLIAGAALTIVGTAAIYAVRSVANQTAYMFDEYKA